MAKDGLTVAGSAGASRHTWRGRAGGRSTGRGRARRCVGSAGGAVEVPMKTAHWRWLQIHGVVDEDLGRPLRNRRRRVGHWISRRRGRWARERSV